MITLPSEIATSAGMFVFAIVQALILLALAPLFSGISRMIRARIQSRRGPGVLQDYRDIAKLMKRQNIWPDNAGWVSKVMPYVLISTVMVVAMSLPLFFTFCSIQLFSASALILGKRSIEEILCGR